MGENVLREGGALSYEPGFQCCPIELSGRGQRSLSKLSLLETLVACGYRALEMCLVKPSNCLSFLFFFFYVLSNIWDISSPTRHQNCVPCSGSLAS